MKRESFYLVITWDGIIHQFGRWQLKGNAFALPVNFRRQVFWNTSPFPCLRKLLKLLVCPRSWPFLRSFSYTLHIYHRCFKKCINIQKDNCRTQERWFSGNLLHSAADRSGWEEKPSFVTCVQDLLHDENERGRWIPSVLIRWPSSLSLRLSNTLNLNLEIGFKQQGWVGTLRMTAETQWLPFVSCHLG